VKEQSKRGFREGLLWGAALALPFALITALLGYGYIGLKKTAVRRGWNLVEAVVASRTLAPGETLSVEDLEVRSVADLMVTADTILPAQLNASIGRRLRVPLAAGQVLHRDFMEGMTSDAEQGEAPACPPAETKPLSAEASKNILSIKRALAQEASR